MLSRTRGVRFGSHRTELVASLRRELEVVGYAFVFYAAFGAASVMMLLARTIVLSRLGEVAAGQLQAAFSIALTVGAVLYPLSNLYLGPLVNGRALISKKVRAANDLAGGMLVLLLPGSERGVTLPGDAAACSVLGFVRARGHGALGLRSVAVRLSGRLSVSPIAYRARRRRVRCRRDDRRVLGDHHARRSRNNRLGIAGGAAALALGVMVWGFLEQLRLHFSHRTGVSRRVPLRLLIVLTVITAAGSIFAGTQETTVSAMAVRLVVAAAIGICCQALLDSRERRLRFWLDALRPQRTADASQIASSSTASILQHDA